MFVTYVGIQFMFILSQQDHLLYVDTPLIPPKDPFSIVWALQTPFGGSLGDFGIPPRGKEVSQKQLERTSLIF